MLGTSQVHNAYLLNVLTNVSQPLCSDCPLSSWCGLNLTPDLYSFCLLTDCIPIGAGFMPYSPLYRSVSGKQSVLNNYILSECKN